MAHRLGRVEPKRAETRLQLSQRTRFCNSEISEGRLRERFGVLHGQALNVSYNICERLKKNLKARLSFAGAGKVKRMY